MRRIRLSSLLLVVLCLWSGLAGVCSAGKEETTVLVNANVIDCTGAPVKSEMTFVVSGDSISAIYKGPPREDDLKGGDRVVDLEGNPLENISNIRNVKMVFKDGIEVDLDLRLGTSRYWDYFGSTGSMSGYLGKAEDAAGFSRRPDGS